MTKTELIEKVEKVTKLTKKDTNQAIDAIINAISGSLVKGDKVTLVGFGSLEVRKRAARKVPVFKAGKALKEAVGKK